MRPRLSIKTALGLGAVALALAPGHAIAGGWHRGGTARGSVDPSRRQADYIHQALGPGLLPSTKQGVWGWGHAYPSLPLFHAPVPPGPGDCLYETGQFPWQRG